MKRYTSDLRVALFFDSAASNDFSESRIVYGIPILQGSLQPYVKIREKGAAGLWSVNRWRRSQQG